MAAPDKPNNLALLGGIIVTIAALVGMIIGCRELYMQILHQEQNTKVLAVVDPRLKDLRAKEQSRLNQYQWADQKAGVVRIPLKRARELTLRDWKARAAAAAPAPAAGEAAAPAPAAETK